MNIISALLEWSSHLLVIAGTIISLWGFKKTRKHGYVLLACAFLISAFISTTLPPINKVRERRYYESQPLEEIELQREIYEAEQKARKEVLTAHNRTPYTIAEVEVNMRLPVYQLLLTLGVWFLVKKEKTNHQRTHSIKRNLSITASGGSE